MGQPESWEAAVLRRFLTGDGALHDLLHRYTHALLAFVGQNVACNQLHSVEERTARWLAHTHDRVHVESFPITQEFLALMLGVRRATVSVKAGILQRAGLIRYSRGRMTILDSDGLRRRLQLLPPHLRSLRPTQLKPAGSTSSVPLGRNPSPQGDR
jgi:hypothetical protein